MTGRSTGPAVVTTAGRLHARWVVHTVGPVWQGGTRGEPDLLRAAYMSSLREAARVGATSVAFPAISTGVYGYPIEPAARVALAAAADFARNGATIGEIRFVLFTQADLEVYRRVLESIDSCRVER